MRVTRRLSIFAVAICMASALAAQQTTVLHNATLIDGSGGPAREHVDVIFQAGLIVKILPAQTAKPAGVEWIDCTGKTVMPGLISAHSHVGVLKENAENSATAYTVENVTAALKQFERYGVTTVLTLGMNRDLVYALREQQRAGSLEGATMLTAGRGIGEPNGAPPLAAAPDQIDRPATVDEARRDVDAFAKHRADIVKVWVDPLHGKAPKMDPAIYAAVIDEAHRKHLRVAAHEYALEDARQLVNDGIDVLAHSVRDKPVDEAFVQSMLQHHTWYIPTLALDEAFYIYAEDPSIMKSEFFRQAAGPALLAKLEAPGFTAKTMAEPATKQHEQDEAIARRNLKALYDAGVLIASGTDSGAIAGRVPGFSEHRELEDLVAAGLTPMQAIADATGSTGVLMHTLDPTLNVGLISPGFSADLLVLNADPLADVRNTRKIAAVYHHGRRVENPAPQN